MHLCLEELMNTAIPGVVCLEYYSNQLIADVVRPGLGGVISRALIRIGDCALQQRLKMPCHAGDRAGVKQVGVVGEAGEQALRPVVELSCKSTFAVPVSTSKLTVSQPNWESEIGGARENST